MRNKNALRWVALVFVATLAACGGHRIDSPEDDTMTEETQTPPASFGSAAGQGASATPGQ